MIFDDSLIKQGEAGGKEAAGQLWNALQTAREALDLPSDVKVVTRVYANLKGLGEVCTMIGMITRPEIMEDFARGFTGSKQLFDFVDVGMGKDRADDKISGIFYPLLSMPQAGAHNFQKISSYTSTTAIVATSFSAARTTTATPEYWKTLQNPQS